MQAWRKGFAIPFNSTLFGNSEAIAQRITLWITKQGTYPFEVNDVFSEGGATRFLVIEEMAKHTGKRLSCQEYFAPLERQEP